MRFISITKPGILFGNIVTLCGGYFFGAAGHPDWLAFLSIFFGMTFIIASGCVFNNYIDQDIDSLMQRTKNRVLVQKHMSGRLALSYATFLFIAGILVVYFGNNRLTLIACLLGFVVYVVLYSLFLKRKSTFGTTLGGIAGAVPPVAGYFAATNEVTIAAGLLFAMLFFWQMPHFYAISIVRAADFSAANIPTLPRLKGMRYTKISGLIYTLLFLISAISPVFFGYKGLFYFLVSFFISLVWVLLAVAGFFTRDDLRWARYMFSWSIITITILSLCLAIPM